MLFSGVKIDVSDIWNLEEYNHKAPGLQKLGYRLVIEITLNMVLIHAMHFVEEL